MLIIGLCAFISDAGLEICLGKTVDDNLLQVMRKEVQQLSDSLDDFKDKDAKDIKSICSTLALFKSELNRAIQVLKNQHQRLQSTCMELRKNQDMIKEEISSKDRDQREMLRISEIHWETRQQQVNDICKTGSEKPSNEKGFRNAKGKDGQSIIFRQSYGCHF